MDSLREENLKRRLKEANERIEQLSMEKEILSGDAMTTEHNLNKTIETLLEALEEAAETLETWRIAEDYSVVAKYRALINKIRG